jgi:RNA polymerase sigma-70 factor (family 1)
MAAYSTYIDQELIALLKQGEAKAMTELYERYWDKLLAVALNRLENLEEAEECVQDVFLKLWKLREQLELKYTLGTYLAAAVRYRAYDLLASQHHKLKSGAESLSDLEETIAGGTDADAALLEKELMERIEHSVKQLPEKCRVIYKLSRADNMSNKDIAKALNISEKAVEAHLTRAFKGIRKNIAITAPIAAFLLGM